MSYDLSRIFIAVLRPGNEQRSWRWHVGSDIKGIENVATIVHSDTLFSAVCHAWTRLFGKQDLDDGLLRFAAQPPFRFSSLFPVNLSQQDYFVPSPYLPVPRPDDLGIFLPYQKLIKQLQFIRLSSLDRWLRMRRDNNTAPGSCQELYLALQQDHQHYREIFWSGTEMGIATDRHGKSSPNTFHRSSSIANKVGLYDYGYYCLCYCPDDTYLARLNVLLQEVGRAGIGGERSIGLGRFQVVSIIRLPPTWQSIFAASNGHPNAHLLLSLYCPSNQEIALIDRQRARYTIVSRKGRFLSPAGYAFKRKRCQLLGEGSYLPAPGQLAGTLVDVTPDIWKQMAAELGPNWHPIYRSGIAMTIPLIEN